MQECEEEACMYLPYRKSKTRTFAFEMLKNLSLTCDSHLLVGRVDEVHIAQLHWRNL